MYYTNIASYISPNAMSLIGVVFAVFAARFFVKDELRYRQFGVLLFKVRFLKDIYDVMNNYDFRFVTTLMVLTAVFTESGHILMQ